MKKSKGFLGFTRLSGFLLTVGMASLTVGVLRSFGVFEILGLNDVFPESYTTGFVGLGTPLIVLSFWLKTVLHR